MTVEAYVTQRLPHRHDMLAYSSVGQRLALRRQYGRSVGTLCRLLPQQLCNGRRGRDLRPD
jgi:hypothetical protein